MLKQMNASSVLLSYMAEVMLLSLHISLFYVRHSSAQQQDIRKISCGTIFKQWRYMMAMITIAVEVVMILNTGKKE